MAKWLTRGVAPVVQAMVRGNLPSAEQQELVRLVSRGGHLKGGTQINKIVSFRNKSVNVSGCKCWCRAGGRCGGALAGGAS